MSHSAFVIMAKYLKHLNEIPKKGRKESYIGSEVLAVCLWLRRFYPLASVNVRCAVCLAEKDGMMVCRNFTSRPIAG